MTELSTPPTPPPADQPIPAQNSKPWRVSIQTVWSHTDNINKWAQIIALVIGALWAGEQFRLLVQPTIVPKTNIGAGLDGGILPHSNRCHLDFRVDMSNDGITPFEVGSIAIQAWRFDSNELLPSGTGIRSLEDMESKAPNLISKYVPKSRVLMKTYPTKSSVHETFTYLLDAQDSVSLYDFKVFAYDTSGRLLDQASAWRTDLCQIQH